MRRNLILTKDGSHTVAVPAMAVTYHSVHGAIQESMHVFIREGLLHWLEASIAAGAGSPGEIRVFEMGFGTGLNALLTFAAVDKRVAFVKYTAIELFPLDREQALQLNYCECLGRPDLRLFFEKMHGCDWGSSVPIGPGFELRKLEQNLAGYSTDELFDLVYYDAFAPSAQPELWTDEVFKKLYGMLRPGGILVTYCSKGDVKRAMQAVGFDVRKLAGPPGKREMLRAGK